MRKSVVHRRTRVFLSQKGRCFYCELPMWLKDTDAARFASDYGLSQEATRSLRCTAEHMEARQDGGTHDQWNIVAACLHCNRQRHANGSTATPVAHRYRVAEAMGDGVWHIPEIQNAFAGMAGTTVVSRAPETSGDKPD